MTQENMIEQIVREVLKNMQGSGNPAPVKSGSGLDPARDYPLAAKRPDLVKTPTNKTLADLTLDKVMAGEITPQDVRITPETLELQAQIAEGVGRPQLAMNFRRAAELTAVPDERVLEIYNALRPYRSTKDELHAIASELESKYNAKVNAAFIREAADVYEKRNRLRQD